MFKTTESHLIAFKHWSLINVYSLRFQQIVADVVENINDFRLGRIISQGQITAMENAFVASLSIH